jgi:hypothetical protein
MRAKLDSLKASPVIGPLLAVLGIGMMLYGIHREEVNVVFAKAIKICLECIGIG